MGLPVEASRVQLGQVLRFVFGEHYMIQMMDGRTYEDKNLETVLAIMHDEFHMFNTTLLLKGGNPDKDGMHPKVEVLQVGMSVVPTMQDPLGQRGKVSLVVSVVKGWSGSIPPPNIAGVVEMVRQAVTMFSLTGEWTQYKKDNL